MARTERQVPLVYFGRPGSLVSMPWPRGDMDKSYGLAVFEFASGTGQYMVSKLASGARQFQLTWNALHVNSYNKIEQYWLNEMGVGPWAFIDPSAMNMLQPNQASATSLLNTSKGFATNTGAADMGTLLSNTASSFIHRTGAPRSLRWQFPVAANSFPVLGMSAPYRNWYGYPVVPALPYTWSSWATPDGTVDSSITVAMKLQWYDASGAQIGSDVSGGDIVVTAWTQLSVTATAPTGAAYVKPIWVITGSTVTTGGSLYLDQMQLEQDSVVNPWTGGTGTRPVEITSFNDAVPFEARMRKSLVLTLRELVA